MPNVIQRKYPIADLKPYPHQKDVFANLAKMQLQELAASMDREGQKHPVEILSDGTIICGHQRTRAAKMLGWTEILAVIRDDLETQGEAAVFDHFVRDNLDRRQLGQLEIARCYRALKENAKKLPEDRRTSLKGVDTRDHLAKRFGMSGRNIERLLKVLDTPAEVQRAVSDNRLSVKEAGEVAKLSKAKQQEIAKEIAKGGKPVEVVKGYLTAQPKHHKKYQTRVKAFYTHVGQALEEVRGVLTKKNLKYLRRLATKHHSLLKKIAAVSSVIIKDAVVIDPAKAKAIQEANLAALAAKVKKVKRG